ncbi:DUF3006 domain-containing protein [Bacillus dakarensis]|uniref:DUF3006 domain-containing protein n=1 Tax=Robertmurraya dakarensis TaxID=1926278 RepID=UPI000981E355|nr:DUF3006 domain-containing protein [Bacillus dakarensis]
MNTGKYTVDRFEGEQAVLLFREDESIQVLKNKTELPADVSEGDILYLQFNEDGELVSSKVLKEETTKAREEVRDLLSKLKNKE